MTASETRMLWVDPRARTIGESSIASLPALLDAKCVLVVNDAATIPASLAAHTARGEQVEIRLLEAPYDSVTRAVLLGAGDFRTPTEHRAPPPRIREGEALVTSAGELRVRSISSLSPRLVELAWPNDIAARFTLLYAAGKPVQYSYVPEPLALWDVQTVFATRPWAVEMPSAARPLRASALLELERRGVRIATLTHAAGLSATGDAAIDAALPLPERYEIPRATVELVARTKQQGGRVLAVGTTVVRALEDAALRHGELREGEGVADLVLTRTTPRRVVDGLLTGVHMPGESHHRLIQSFVDDTTLARAVELARAGGYRQHEFGDACLILPGVARANVTPRAARAGEGAAFAS